MGQLANDMTDGQSCSGCGVYFVRAHGFPVLCHHCWSIWTPEQRKTAGLQRATQKEA